MVQQRSRVYEVVQVDVFTDRVFGGNPLAVFLDGRGLSDLEMQAIALEMNLSETVFLLPPADVAHAARLRIFTPARELAFAGHPTVGAAYVLATRGRLPDGASEAILEEGVGPVTVRLEGDPRNPRFIWMRHPPATFGEPLGDRAAFARALSVSETDLLPRAPIQVGSTGSAFLYVPLRDRDAVDRAALDVPALLACFSENQAVGVFVFAPDPDPAVARVYARMFAPHTSGIPEDPATGSAHGPLGVYLVREGLASGGDEVTIASEQGTKMGRQSFLQVRVRRGRDGAAEVEVGGGTVDVLEGVLRLPQLAGGGSAARASRR